MRREELWRSLAPGLFHLFPERDRGLRIVAGAGGELDADAVRFALAFAAVRQLYRIDRRELRSGQAEVRALAPAQRDGGDLQPDLRGHGDRHALLGVVGERMRDLVAHDL